VALAPHCTAGFLGIAASLHVAAAIPFFLIHEFYPDNAGGNPRGSPLGERLGRAGCSARGIGVENDAAAINAGQPLADQ